MLEKEQNTRFIELNNAVGGGQCAVTTTFRDMAV